MVGTQDSGALFIVLVAITILLLLLIVVVILFSVFMRRKNTLLVQQERDRQKFEQELTETQIEIREETLRNISWELHDNIGQLLTLAKIQTQNSRGKAEDIDEAVATIGKGLTEVRALSKLINPEALNNMVLPEALELELDRFKRMAFLEPILKVKGVPIVIEKKIETIIFRILQEFLTNTVKHSKASTLKVNVHYKIDSLHVSIADDGIGFDYAAARAKNGIGLTNIETRAKLIGAEVNYDSKIGEGTQMTLTYKPKVL